MPLETCAVDGKPGYRWGARGKCYTYDPNSDQSRTRAKRLAISQGIAVEGPAQVQAILDQPKK